MRDALLGGKGHRRDRAAPNVAGRRRNSDCAAASDPARLPLWTPVSVANRHAALELTRLVGLTFKLGRPGQEGPARLAQLPTAARRGASAASSTRPTSFFRSPAIGPLDFAE